MAEQWVWLARIRRPQGRKGEVFADILTDFPEKFTERRRLWLLDGRARAGGDKSVRAEAETPAREVELLRHWLHKGGVVLHFSGVDSISEAETLSGLVVAVPVTERVALPEDEVYIGDLIGCVLVDVARAEPVVVGEIEDVDRTAGAVALLVVRGVSASQRGSELPNQQDGGEILIPFAKSYLRRIDLEGKRVEMALPEGLADLNG
jgi:16S rRNA processing protein RimM